MSTLGFHYCFHHLEREAVAQCPDCKRVFCRECITEHEDRIICASCLQRLVRAESGSTAPRSFSWAFVTVPMRITMALCVGWLCFYTVGRLLLSLPSEFHSGAVWGHAGELLDEP
jgi:hypothetical protein